MGYEFFEEKIIFPSALVPGINNDQSLSSQIDEDPSSIWLRWKTLFVDLLNKHAPVSTIRIKINSASYLTKEIKSMMYQRDYLKSKAYKTGSKYLRQA